MPHEIQGGNCDDSGFRTNHGGGWYATTCTRPALGCRPTARNFFYDGADMTPPWQRSFKPTSNVHIKDTEGKTPHIGPRAMRC